MIRLPKTGMNHSARVALFALSCLIADLIHRSPYTRRTP